ncbi:MAG: hypothetical protein JWQ83_2002 [Lacunisphaera sp.]|nr:hypothetical protein [Lacunisphaera sp.]MDB6166862.1 hypothetical protein [Lacunisphaera sp.]
MRARLQQQWKILRAGQPGQRFQDRYHRHQRSASAGNWLHRVGRFVAAALATAIGVVLVFIPGPAIVFFALAGALLASDCLWLARVLDWSEVKLRRLWNWGRRFWQHLSVAGRVALLAVGGGLSAATTYGVYRLMT